MNKLSKNMQAAGFKGPQVPFPPGRAAGRRGANKDPFPHGWGAPRPF